MAKATEMPMNKFLSETSGIILGYLNSNELSPTFW